MEGSCVGALLSINNRLYPLLPFEHFFSHTPMLLLFGSSVRAYSNAVRVIGVSISKLGGAVFFGGRGGGFWNDEAASNAGVAVAVTALAGLALAAALFYTTR